MNRILVVDDEPRMRLLIHDFLRKAGYEVAEAIDGVDALNYFYANNSQISLIILDVMMPRKDGLETLKEIREVSDVPVILLTAKDTERDELMGFDVGADEYITKPFSPKILIARVDAILRRRNENRGETVSASGLVIDDAAHTVSIDGKDIELSYKEYELLMYFFANKGIALSREIILDNVWNYDYAGDTRTIDTHVKKLRAKLGEYGDMIKTVRGMGYKFVPD